MSTLATTACAQCGKPNPAGAKFCNSCGKAIAVAAPQPVLSPTSLPGRAAHAPVAEHGGAHAATHHSDKFYGGIFLALAVITLVEIFLTNVGSDLLRYGGLVILSIAKFALVVMFFMHLKGDKRLFGTLFLVPLAIGAAILLSLVALFGRF
ncbi:MAG: hypothetical protein EXR49_08285 [Dehalococcoidia bacterium]|nr:hypothetical protein [Dehalococcoidia bacterium]